MQSYRWEGAFCDLYDMYMVTLNETKSILEVSAQAGESGVENKTSVDSRAQNNDFSEVKR